MNALFLRKQKKSINRLANDFSCLRFKIFKFENLRCVALFENPTLCCRVFRLACHMYKDVVVFPFFSHHVSDVSEACPQIIACSPEPPV